MRLGVFLFSSGLLLAQTDSAPQDKCRVEGRVVNSVTGEPVRRAKVTLRLNPAAPVMGVGGVGVPPPPGAAGSLGSLMSSQYSTTSSGPSSSGQAAANMGSTMPFMPMPSLSSGTPRPAPITAATDAEGRFVFTGLDPGDYQIAAQRDNFQYVAPRRPEPVSLKTGDSRKDVVLKVAPLGVIAGVIRDEYGDPVQNVQVSLMSWTYGASGRQLSPRGGALTDDQGAYRLFGVTPGKYYLRASPPMRRGSDEEETFVASYYPNALDPTGAAPVELRPGQEMRGIDLAVRRARAITVRGRVIKPAGAASVQLGLTQLVEGGGSMNTNTDLRDQEGKFEWRGMLPGSYAISAQATVGDRRYSARYSLQAGSSDIDNIELRLAQAPELKGIIRIEGSADVQPSRVMVRFEGRSGRSTSTMASRIMMGDGRILSSSGGVGEDGTFTVPALDPDFYRISVTAPGNLFLQSATCGNADVIEAGLDLSGGAACDLTVVVSANAGQVDGQVSDENSQPATAARVALVPTGSRRTDLFKTAVADPNGHFTIQGVAPGSYKVYAWEEVDMNAVHYDPEFVKPYESSGQSVHINEGSKETVNLKQIKTPAER